MGWPAAVNDPAPECIHSYVNAFPSQLSATPDQLVAVGTTETEIQMVDWMYGQGFRKHDIPDTFAPW